MDKKLNAKRFGLNIWQTSYEWHYYQFQNQIRVLYRPLNGILENTSCSRVTNNILSLGKIQNTDTQTAFEVIVIWSFMAIWTELNVLRDEFSSIALSSIAIELTFVALRCGFKKAGSVSFDIGDSWDKDF